MRWHLISNFLGLVGAVVGAVLGFYTFRWLYHQGYYGLMIPGSFLGLGCGLLAQHHSMVRGIFCGVAAVLWALFTEWWFYPFVANESLRYFMAHVTELKPVTLLMTGLGAAIAYWVGKDAGFRWLPESRAVSRPDSAYEPAKKD